MKIVDEDLVKKIFIIIFIVLFLVIEIVLVITFNNKRYENNEVEDTLLLGSLDVEINTEVNLLSLVSSDNKVKILSEDEIIDTTTLGEKEYTIKYLSGDEETLYTFNVNIVDTIAPEIEFEKELTTTIGSKIDLLKDVECSDNSLEEIEVSVEGDYDFDTEGEYTLKYVAIDSSNNKTEEEFTLKVNAKKTTTTTTTTNNQTPKKTTTTTNQQTTPTEEPKQEETTTSEEVVETPSNTTENTETTETNTEPTENTEEQPTTTE